MRLRHKHLYLVISDAPHYIFRENFLAYVIVCHMYEVPMEARMSWSAWNWSYHESCHVGAGNETNLSPLQEQQC